MVGKADALVVIPFYRLKRAAVDCPQILLISIERFPKLLGVVNLRAVDFNLMLSHDKWPLVARSGGIGPHPLTVEEVSHAIGCALHGYKGERLRSYTGGDRAQEAGRIVERRIFPEGHLAEMGHSTVLTTGGLLILA